MRTPRLGSTVRHPRRRQHRLAIAAAGFALLLTACSSDNEATAADAPASLTPEQTCALLTDSTLADLVGVEQVSHEAGPSTAPEACVYAWDPGTGVENLFVAVLDSAATAGNTGSAALAHVLDEVGITDPVPLDGVPAESSIDSAGMGQRVFAVAETGALVSLMIPSALSIEQQAAITNSVLDGLADQD